MTTKNPTREQVKQDWENTCWYSPTPGLIRRGPRDGRLYPEARIYDDYLDGVVLEVSLWPAGRKPPEGSTRRLFDDNCNSLEEAKKRAEAFVEEQVG